MSCGCVTVAGAETAAPAPPVSPGQIEAATTAGIEFLRGTQNEDGSWSPAVGPAITALVVAAMLDAPVIDAADPAVQRGLRFILSHRRPDGGIHAGMLANYNTAICVSTLSRLPDDVTAQAAVREGRQSLIRLQWNGQRDAAGVLVDRAHPFYGGSGYGKHGRPDLSNTQVMLQALRDSGLPASDPAYRRALIFITRCQGTPGNDMYADRIANDGGFIYSTSTNAERVHEPQSMAGSGRDADAGEASTGAPAPSVSALRTYGSMTYAGFKSYVFAELARDDPRVTDAQRWISRHYTVTHNPGMPLERRREGYFYYLVTMARALEAWGERHIVAADGTPHDWRADLAAQLVSLQRSDGAWINTSSRWMETDPNLITAFALTALHCTAR